MAVLVLSGPENFAKREKLRRSLVVPGTVVILMPGKIVKDVQKYNILSRRMAIIFLIPMAGKFAKEVQK